MKQLFLLALFAGQMFAANSLTITELTTSTQTNRPFTIPRYFAEGEIANYPRPVIGGTPATTWQADVKTRWPGGTVKHAFISFKNTITGSGTLIITFQNSTDPCSSGNLAACNAASLDQAGMVAFDAGAGAGNWRARIQTVASSITQSAEARTMINAGEWTYWLRGPVVTRVLVEDKTTALGRDWGYQCTANCTTTYSTATWVTAPSATYKSLHPIFEVSFYTGFAGVEVDYILENPWSTKLQDQVYNLTLTKNEPETNAFTQAGLTHWARARWHKHFWNGTTPGRVKTDHNLSYLIESKALPNFDTTKVVPPSTVTSVNNSWASTDQAALMGNYTCQGNLNCTGFWLKYMPNTGGRQEIGLFPTWVVRYLYTFDTLASGPDLYSLMLLNSDAVGSAPMHVREANTSSSLKFCALSELCVTESLQTVDAFGRVRTRDAYPTNLSTSPIAGVTLSSSHNWSLDTAHQGSMGYIAYLVDGSYYYLQEMNYWAGWDIERSPVGTTRWYMGHNDWGYLRDQIRGMAWSMRNVGHAAVMNPDATPEKAYFTQKILNNISVHEGKANITTGYGHANDLTKWTWGNTQGSGIADVNQTTHKPNPLYFTSWETPSMEGIDTAITRSIQPQWQAHFFFIVVAHLEELGFPITALKQALAENIINQLQNPSFNPYLIDAYRTPAIIKAGGDHYATTWAEVKSGFLSSEQTRTSINPAQLNNPDSGYIWYAQAAASFLPGLTAGAYTGDGAWAWFNGKLNQSLLNSNPKFALVPRSTAPAAPVVNSSSTAAGLVGSAFSYQITASGTPTSYNATGLPSGLSVNTMTGVISGTPAGAAVSNITLTATNAVGTSNNFALTLTVTDPAPMAPVISSSATASGSVAVAFTYQITASNTPTSYSASGLPAGLSINTGTGLISGTPTTAGVSNVTLGAINAGGTGPLTLTLTVAPVSACDLNADGVINGSDVTISIQYSITSTATGDLGDGDGISTVVDTQRIVNAALGGMCRTGA